MDHIQTQAEAIPRPSAVGMVIVAIINAGGDGVPPPSLTL